MAILIFRPKENEPTGLPQPFRFSLRWLFALMTSVAVLLALALWLEG